MFADLLVQGPRRSLRFQLRQEILVFRAPEESADIETNSETYWFSSFASQRETISSNPSKDQKAVKLPCIELEPN